MAEIGNWSIGARAKLPSKSIERTVISRLTSRETPVGHSWVRYSVGAAAALLLIVTSGIAYYKYVWSAPLTTTSPPLASLNQNPSAVKPSASSLPSAAPKTEAAPALSPKLPADNPNRSEAVRRFIQRYDGGDCFFMMPIAVSASAAVIEGFSTATAPFDLFDKAFKQSQGFEASIGVRLVAPPQCPAITFLNRFRAETARSPRISLGSVKLKPGETLVGSIENFANRIVELLLVADDGQVQNLSYFLKPGTDALSFAIELPRSDKAATGPLPQLVMAIATPRVIDSLRQPRPTPADQLFLQALSEAQRSNIAINVAVRYFTVQK